MKDTSFTLSQVQQMRQKMTIQDSEGDRALGPPTADLPQEVGVLWRPALCLWYVYSVPCGVLGALYTLLQF